MIEIKEHSLTQFDAELRILFNQLDTLNSYMQSFSALIHKSLDDGENRTDEARAIDRQVNQLEFAIDQQVMRLISKFAPMVDELRLVLAALKIASSCERASDKLKNTAKRVGRLSGLLDADRKEHCAALLMRAGAQMDKVMVQFSVLDDAAMEQIIDEREEIHQLYKRSVIGRGDLMGELGIQYSLILRNIERVSELAYDIAKIGYAARHNRKFEKTESSQ